MASAVYVLCAVLASLVPLHVAAESSGTADALNAEAMAIVKRFAGTLKPKLKSAIESGGPVNAVEICAVEAPQIAATLSSETGWTVKRVSLKPRNKDSAVADPWEATLLQGFEARLAAGDAPRQLVHSQVVDGRYRFIKAQVTEGLCLNCHGQSLHPAVAAAIKRHYPRDQATGYSLGQVRGAFSLSKKLQRE